MVRDSILPYLYNSSSSKLESNYLSPHLFARLGCPKILHTICAATFGSAWDQVFGEMLSVDPLDVSHSKFVVVWAANPSVSNTHLLPLISKVRKSGGKLVVVDPRLTGTASHIHTQHRSVFGESLFRNKVHNAVIADAWGTWFITVLATSATGVIVGTWSSSQ